MAHPYRRSLDLSKLHDFSEPGDYRVQIVYDNVGLTLRANGEWGGHFAGPVMSIRIK